MTDGFGPHSAVKMWPPEDGKEGKLTMRTVKATGEVVVTLWTREVPEDEIPSDIRETAGLLVDPSVTIDELSIECLAERGEQPFGSLDNGGVTRISASSPNS